MVNSNYYLIRQGKKRNRKFFLMAEEHMQGLGKLGVSGVLGREEPFSILVAEL